jgi:hypothetical protein
LIGDPQSPYSALASARLKQQATPNARSWPARLTFPVRSARNHRLLGRERHSDVLDHLLNRQDLDSILVVNINPKLIFNRQNERHTVQRVSAEITGESAIATNEWSVNSQSTCD